MIHYIGCYTNLSSQNKKNVSPAGVTKMTYIARKIRECGYDCTIYSPAYSVEKKFVFLKMLTYFNQDGVLVKESATLSTPNFFFKIISLCIMHFQLLSYLFRINRNDIVVVYHSFLYWYDIKFFKLLKRNKVIFEVEELFSAAYMEEDWRKELNYIAKADAYIYVNDVMNEKFLFNKPFAVANGNYSIDKNFFVRKNTHSLIYAGVLGGKGSDVDLAIDVMDFLPSYYSLSIAGYGADEEISYIKAKIAQYKNISFQGYLSGESYEEFLKKGELGLCTRVLPNKYSDYTFPSKVLVYLTHGIMPVCPRLDIIAKSKISDMVLFYDVNEPREIARAIVCCDNNNVTKERLLELDRLFKDSLNKMLSNF